MADILGHGLILFGLFFLLTACIGIVKFPDVYTRLHAASKGTTFGFAGVILGVAILLGEPMGITKALVAIVFQFVTTPVACHMIARVALKRGVIPVTEPPVKSGVETSP